MATRDFTPDLMTPALGAHLRDAGYNLPESWPFPARVVVDVSARNGWAVKHEGGTRDELRTVYIAPDGSRYVKASHGSRVALVDVSKKLSPRLLRVAPGARRPTWVIADTPKGEIPEHLRKYLLKPGQKLSKGEKREAEIFATEPEAPASSRGGRAGSAVAVLGPRPKPGTPQRTEWNRQYRALRAEHFAAYRAARKNGGSK